MSWFTDIFTGGGIVKAAENIALEIIDTDKESAEAKVMAVKALDPNGKMRRDLSKFTSYAYGFYLVNTTILLYLVAFDVGDFEGAKEAATMMTELFVPITTAWGGIVGASFGVNTMNSYKGK